MLKHKKYGVCFWLLNKDNPKIILDNKWADFDKLNPQGKIFDIEEEQGDYFEIFYGNDRYAILKNAFEIVHHPFILDIGSPIFIKNKLEENGVIAERFWHFKANEPYYNVSFKGKISSKRYFPKDIFNNQYIRK